MPAKAVVSVEGNLKSAGMNLSELAKQREEFDVGTMAELMYQNFEGNIERLEDEQGITMPPLTDMNGNIVSTGYHGNMQKVASGQHGRTTARPASSSESAIVALSSVREDMLKRYSAVSHDPVMASTLAMSIQKLETEIISMGGEVDRFDPAHYQSGLKPIAQVAQVDQKVVAEKVVENTKQAYTLKPIKKIYSGASKTGKQGICIKIALAQGTVVHGTVVPKEAFTGGEVIDYVPDGGKGRMTVKTASGGYWNDISSNFDIAWVIEAEKS